VAGINVGFSGVPQIKTKTGDVCDAFCLASFGYLYLDDGGELLN